jgi:Mce-associated membrane protein
VTAFTARLRRRASRPGRALPRPSVTVAVLTIVVIALAVATILLLFQWHGDQTTSNAESGASAAAAKDVPALLSYESQTIAADIAKAKADCTPQFASTYGQAMASQVKQTAAKNHVDTETTVSDTSVASSASGKVTLLVFISSQTKTDAKAESVLNDTAVKVTMQKVGGAWLVSNLVPES